jgi:hypothetical protein
VQPTPNKLNGNITDVFCLRVKRDVAGKLWPFDRTYFAKNGPHAIFKKLFRYALVLPVETALKSMLLDYVHLDVGEAVPFDRDEEAVPPTQVTWREELELHDWVMAVPVLSKYVASNLPRYITAAGKYRQDVTSTKRRRIYPSSEVIPSPFPGLTYLQTPTQNIRPVCVACPNFINHQNGHCHLGQSICYTNLSLGMTNHFEEGTKVPAGSGNMHLQDEE